MEPAAGSGSPDLGSAERAAQKLNLSSSPHRRKRHSSGEDDTNGPPVSFRTDYGGIVHRSPPPVPPALLRRIGVREVSGVGKVKVMLRVSGGPIPGGVTNGTGGVAGGGGGGGGAGAVAGGGPGGGESLSTGPAGGTSSFFSIDKRRKQVTLFDPAACGGGSSAPEDRRVGVAAPKMFAFDAIFSQEDSQTEVCSSALTDVIHAVINGTDGCLFCFGHARLGKTYTMLGSSESASTLGVIPCAISWLFRGINEQKQKTGARFSVRVSAVEVTGPQDQLRDLLAGHANDSEQSPGVYLRDDPLFGTQLQNQSELRVPTAEKAAFYLDAAVAVRGRLGEEVNGGTMGQNHGAPRNDSHLLYTLHVYQYSVDKSGKGGVAGGRSRLHLIDLGSCERGKANGGIPLSGLGNVLLAIFNGQKHLPHRDSKVAQLLKECLSSLTCHAAMIAHVSPYAAHYTDTLATVQLASRIHRMRRRKIRFTGGSTGSGGSSGEENRPGVGGPGMGNFSGHHPQDGSKSGSSDVDPSSSEQSADTVIYVGPSADDATDGEHPPVYLPSLNSGDNRCSMQKALRGSGAERRPSPSAAHRSSSASKAQASPGKSKLAEGPSSTHSSPSRSIKTTKPAYINGRAGSPAILTSSGIPKSPQSSRQSKSKGSAEISQSGVPQSGSPGGNLPGGKMPVYNAAGSGGQAAGSGKGSVSGASPLPGKHSDEHWIDGPRISRSRVAEARSLMLKEGHRKKETWVDGPQAGYGFMDSHKKNMIQRWVENQAVQIQKQQLKHHTRPALNGSPAHGEAWDSGDAKDKKSRQYKELTVFKTCDDENEGASKVIGGGPSDQKAVDEVEVVRGNNLSEPGVMLADDLISEGGTSNERIPRYGSDEELEGAAGIERGGGEERREEEEDEDDGVGDIPPPLPLLHQHNKEISIDVSLDSFDVRLRILQERHGSTEIRNPGLGGEDVEIIEVEEPEEPVPMQDSCLQVTEEDIALCMGEVENPLPEVDQESQEEHPLRILSQENLTVVSTFTDSLSVTNDIERTLLAGMGDNLRQQLHHQQHFVPSSSDPASSYNIFESSRNGKVCDENLGNLNGGNNCSKADFYARKFDQLAKLHELCRTVAASGSKAREPLSTASNLPHLPSRCQSLSLSDMLYGPRTRLGEDETCLGNGGEDYGGICDGMQGGGGGSLYSEPVNHSGSPPLGKICDHCKMSLRRGVGVEGSEKQWQNDCEVQSEGGILNTCLQSKVKAAPVQNIPPVPASPKAEHMSPSHKAQARSSNGTEFHRVSLAFRGFDRDSPRSSPTPPNQVPAPTDSGAGNQRSNATSSPHKLLGSFSSLRHPDGASNPNLDKHSSTGMEFVEERRVPGNGQSTSDHEEEGGKVQGGRTGHNKPKKTEHSKDQLKEIRRDEEERVSDRKPSGERTVMGKSDDEDNVHHKWVQPPPITTPPMPQPLPIPTPIVKAPKLSRLFGSARKSSKAALKASVASLGSAIPVNDKQDKKSRKASGKVQTMLASSSSVLEGYDSGNDSGIVSASGAVAGITSGRVSAASVITTPIHSTKLDRAPHKGSLMKGDLAAAAGQCESSGYESVLRDSECSSFGSSQELDDRASGPVAAAGGRDAELEGDSFGGGMEMDCNACCDEVGGSRDGVCRCLPLLQYCQEDVERLERRWTAQEVIRWSQIRQLRAQQQELKRELAAAKQRLLIHPSRWSYELHVEASMDYRDPSFVEALEKETVILRKRVEACKSHVLIATCFDAIPPRTVT